MASRPMIRNFGHFFLLQIFGHCQDWGRSANGRLNFRSANEPAPPRPSRFRPLFLPQFIRLFLFSFHSIVLISNCHLAQQEHDLPAGSLTNTTQMPGSPIRPGSCALPSLTYTGAAHRRQKGGAGRQRSCGPRGLQTGRGCSRPGYHRRQRLHRPPLVLP